jgi:DNA-binding transcriptional regulator YiaG
LQWKIGELIAELHDVKSRAAKLEEENGTLRAKTDNRKKLRPFEVHQIRKLYSNGMSQAEIAAVYAVNPATISRTVRKVYH